MIDEFDLDQDGEIDEQEFLQIMMDEPLRRSVLGLHTSTGKRAASAPAATSVSHTAMSAGRNQYYEFYRQSRYVAAIGSHIASGSSSQMRLTS